MKSYTEFMVAGFSFLLSMPGGTSLAETFAGSSRGMLTSPRSQKDSYHENSAERQEAVGAALHSLTGIIRIAKTALAYGVVDSARDLQTELRVVYMALEAEDLDLARTQIEDSLYTLRQLERKASMTNVAELDRELETLSRQYFYSRQLILDDDSDSPSDEQPDDDRTDDDRTDDSLEQITIQLDTVVKTSSAQSTKLSDKEKCFLRKGEVISGKYLGLEASHLKLRLSTALSRCPLMKEQTTVFVYKDHALLND